MKDMGVYLYIKLTFQYHLNYIAPMVIKRLNFIIPDRHPFRNVVRHVWCPHSSEEPSDNVWSVRFREIQFSIGVCTYIKVFHLGCS